MREIIQILVVEPGKAPYEAKIENSLESLKKALGGEVEIGCFLPQRVLLISREDQAGFPPNRYLPQSEEYIRGTFLLCGVPDEGSDFASLTPRQKSVFQDVFEQPGSFATPAEAVSPADAAAPAHFRGGNMLS